MMDLSQYWRTFLRSAWLQAAAIGLIATMVVLVLTTVIPSLFVSIDWLAYDAWLKHRTAGSASHSLIVVTRDQASEAKFGTDQWDRAILARAITDVHDAGAAAIGFDHRLGHASPAHLGGAASDALLLEATKAAGHVVFAYDSESPLTTDATVFGHLLTAPNQDRVVRAVPLSTELGAQVVPAFGLALFEQARNRKAPPGDALVNYLGDGSLASLPTLSFAILWDAIEKNRDDQLAGWFKDKIVILLPDPAPATTWLLPTGQSVSGSIIHAHLLNMLLTDNRICRLGALSSYLVTLFLAGLVAWALLSFRNSHGLILAGAVVVSYGLVLTAAMTLLHLVLPLALPSTAITLVLIGTTIWNQTIAHQRMMLLEQDMLKLQQESAAVREALVLRETRKEMLEEDLTVARAALTQSTGRQEELVRSTETLRSQLVETQTQEEEARRQLEGLEQQLHNLRAVRSEPTALGDVELHRLRDECGQLGIVTQDTTLLRLYRDLKKGAKSQLTVLLLGEPGTGKELFARAVHRLSQRTNKTFIAVNMAAISPELFESELFGHTRGSFTGATADRRGYFELANHGTIFLDEIGDLRLDHQSKLLRVLQEKSFYRVGATSPTMVDVRIVAATNRDLSRGVADGWFREDLYFRLTGLVFRLPPLRERAVDIPHLAETLLTDTARQMGKPVPKLSNDALHALVEQEWKGNVRELRHCLEQAVALSDSLLLTRESLRLGATQTPATSGATQILPGPAGDAAVLHCLRRHGFDMQATANTLDWDRSTVTQRLKGLCFQALVEANGDQASAALAIAGDPRHLRTVELKLMDYHGHLLSVIQHFATADEALLECKRRFKNLPDRHFASVTVLVRRHVQEKSPALLSSAQELSLPH